jgi:DNA polymerase (family 10)
MQFHRDLLAGLPRPLRELLAVPGVGPKTAARLLGETNVRSVRGLLRAARRGQLQRLRGFGPRREANLAAAAGQLLAERTSPPAPLPGGEGNAGGAGVRNS